LGDVAGGGGGGVGVAVMEGGWEAGGGRGVEDQLEVSE